MLFNSLTFPPELLPLVTADNLAAYPRSKPEQSLKNGLKGLSLLGLAPNVQLPHGANELPSPDALRHWQCCQSGLWLLLGFLTESHSLSQELDTPEGSLWHAIMHRLEGDYSNSKYWYRVAGRHPVEQAISQRLVQLSGSATMWSPSEFVDACRNTKPTSEATILRQVARIEWEELFAYSFSQVIQTRSSN